MKRLTIFILLLSNLAHAQFEIDNIPSKTYTLGGFGNLHSDGFITGIEGGLLFPKHWANIGVAVSPAYYSTAFQNWALNLNYNYLPNDYSKRFDLFFDFNFILRLSHNNLIVYDQNGNLIDDKKFLLRNDLNLGFGFNTNISKNVYIKTSVGAGISINEWQTSTIWSFSGNARFSIGYRFLK
jgi:hypothetical protein